MWLLLEKRLRGDENSRSAVAALSGAEIGEALLQRMEAVISGKALDRGDVPRVALHRQHQAREHRVAIEEYRARTTRELPVVRLRPQAHDSRARAQ